MTLQSAQSAWKTITPWTDYGGMYRTAARNVYIGSRTTGKSLINTGSRLRKTDTNLNVPSYVVRANLVEMLNANLSGNLDP